MRFPTAIRLAVLAALVTSAAAERLPLKTYTTADGLASSFIERITRDSRGLLWFATRDGLSRFDGVRFTTYTMKDGLPHPTVNHLLETRGGEYWVATNGGGICRFQPKPRPGKHSTFVAYRLGETPPSNRVNILHEDRNGRLWAGTDAGVFRWEAGAFRTVALASVTRDVWAFAEDGEGNLWIGHRFGLTRIGRDGIEDHQKIRPSERDDLVHALLVDREANLWVGHARTLMVRRRNGSRRWYAIKDGLADDRIAALHQAADGRIWIGTLSGLAEFDGERFRGYTAQDLPMRAPQALAEDINGNIWVASEIGATKFTLRGLNTYTPADGIGQVLIHSLFEDSGGRLIAVGPRASLSRFDGRRFQTVHPRLPEDILFNWASRRAYLDRSGQWWLLTQTGLRRLPRTKFEHLHGNRPRAVYDRRNGLLRDYIFCVFEDRRGDLWIGSSSSGPAAMDAGLTRWDRARDTFQVYTAADGLPPPPSLPSAFAEDPQGNLWIGFQYGGIARYAGKRFRYFGASAGVPDGALTALHVDGSGRLWLATNQSGVARVDDPASERPRFRVYSMAKGLSSNNVRCLTEDSAGRIYLGTVRGVDRLDPETGAVRHYTTGDGLANDFVTTALRDRSGALWFGTMHGLSRLMPASTEPSAAPPIWIGGLRVAGVPHPVSELGQTEVADLVANANQNHIAIEFFSLGFGMGHTPGYQYKLEGTDRNWSAPSDQRTVHYASLQPGSYRFLVRAVAADGAVSSTPAAVSFRVLPPFWQSWWFLAPVTFLAMSGVYVAHRVRVARLLGLERVRTRIATDLHDDIGSSLSRIAILSEVTRRQITDAQDGVGPKLAEIAETARGVVDSMSDIVWSIDPRRDDVDSVIARIRQFAADVLDGKGVAWEFRVPEELEKLHLDPDQRRHLYLVLKEALTNVARHSQCRTVCVAMRRIAGRFTVAVRDDGCGFAAANGCGHGLENMRARAIELGGTLEVQSEPGKGTQLTLDFPA